MHNLEVFKVMVVLRALREVDGREVKNEDK